MSNSQSSSDIRSRVTETARPPNCPPVASSVRLAKTGAVIDVTKFRLLDVLSESTGLQRKDVTSVPEHFEVAWLRRRSPCTLRQRAVRSCFRERKTIDDTAIKESS